MNARQYSVVALIAAIGISPLTTTATSQHGSAAPASSAAPNSASAEAPERVLQPVPINQTYTFQVSGACHYRADVRGTLSPVANERPTPANDESEVLIIPNVAVDAIVDCGHTRPRQVHASALPVRPMSRAQFERALDAYATARANETGCIYRPDFELQGQQVVARGIAPSCANNGAAQGGGPPPPQSNNGSSTRPE